MNVELLRAAGIDVAQPAVPYYARLTIASAVRAAREVVDEWDYEADAHGYCHARSMLVALLVALGEVGVG